MRGDEPFPVVPNSSVDQALTMIAHRLPALRPNLVYLVDPRNPAHMLALGTRVMLYQRGVTDPLQLVESLYRQWYGVYIADGHSER